MAQKWLLVECAEQLQSKVGIMMNNNIHTKKNALALLLSSVLIVGLSLHIICMAATSPVRVLREASNQMIAALHANRTAIRRGDSNVIHRIVKRTIIPHMALDRMASAVVGRYHWGRASQRQRRQFINAFVDLVINTYAAALSSYENQKVKFLPLRGNIRGLKFVQVNSLIVHDNGSSIPVNYQMILLGKRWKVKDFSVDGVVLTRSYRSQFAKILEKGGLSSLTEQLIKHNRIR